MHHSTILSSLEFPSWDRLFHIYDAIKLGIPFKTIKEKTKIDNWFLRQIEELVLLEKDIEHHSIKTISKDLLFDAKQKGYADKFLFQYHVGFLSWLIHFYIY